MDKTKEEKEEKKKSFSMWKEIMVLLLPVILCLILDYGICDASIVVLSVRAFFFSAIIMVCLLFLLTAVFKKVHRSVYVMSAIVFLLIIINHIKYLYTKTPILLTDIGYLGEVFQITSIVKDDILSNINYFFIFAILLLLTITNIIAKKLNVEIKNKKTRILGSIICVLILIVSFAPIKIKNEFLLKNIYCTDERNDFFTPITCKEYYAKYSVLAGLYGLLLENQNTAPEEYVKEDVEKFISELDYEKNEAITVKPNIILMFQESYWDITQIEEVEFDKDINKNMDELKSKGAYAKMLSPSYGGLSSNIEFELLTGGNLGYFNSGYNPFLQMYTKKESEENPSILKELNNNGYNTKVLFGYDYYNSHKIYERLGVNTYINAVFDKEDYFENIKGEYISDKALVDYVLEELKNKPEDEKLFYMTATIQSHMPYKGERYSEYDISIKNSTLKEGNEEMILSYAQGVYDTNIQIQRLYDEIQKIDEPTIIIVLGDHLPYIQNYDGEDVLQEDTSYFNTGNEKLDMLRKYTTETLILSNYDDGIEFESEYISPDLILTTVINNIDIELSPFYRWIYETRNTIAAQNQYLIIDNESNVYYINEELPENIEKIKNLRKNVQYYLFKEEK